MSKIIMESFIVIALILSVIPMVASSQEAIDVTKYNIFNVSKMNLGAPRSEFGDQHSMESGALSFNVVDVSVPGNNNLQVEFRRKSSVRWLDFFDMQTNSRSIGNWEIDLPVISSVNYFRSGWITSDPSGNGNYCSVSNKNFISPPDFDVVDAAGSGSSSAETEVFPAASFWVPPSLSIPGRGEIRLIYNTGQIQVPSDGLIYRWLTKDMGFLSCLDSVQNPELLPGGKEGYLLRTAEGNKYWFDWAASGSFDILSSSIVHNSSVQKVIMPRRESRIYPTRIEDKFGNWVKFIYLNSGLEPVMLNKIESSDGRSIEIQYSNGMVSSVSSGGKVWNYHYHDSHVGYSTPNLREVVNPDGSKWTYSDWGAFGGFSYLGLLERQLYPDWNSNPSWTLTQNPDFTSGSIAPDKEISVTNPSGATAEFGFNRVIIGKSGVPRNFYIASWGGQYPHHYSIIRPFVSLGWDSYRLTYKKVSGSGLSDSVWRYSYQSDIGFIPKVGGKVVSKALQPDGSLRVFTYGNTHGVDEGLLLQIEETSNGSVVSMQKNTYGVSGIYPILIGFDPDLRGDGFMDSSIRPHISSFTYINGYYFSWEIESFDGFYRPLRIKRSSGIYSSP